MKTTKNLGISLVFLTILIISSSMFSGCKTNNLCKDMNAYRNIEPLKTMKDLKYPYEVKYAALSGNINLAYVDEGSGEYTIIFIHGLGSYLPAWKKNIEGLKANYRCIAIDLPGYGKSSKAPHSGMMSFYAGVVNEFIENLKLKNVVLAGHSMGGQISIMAAINFPETIKKLILVDPAGFEEFTVGQKQWFRDVMTLDGVKNTTVEQIQTNLGSNFYNVPADADFMITDRIAMRTADDFENYCYAVVQSVNGMVDEPVFNLLDKIKQPTLILFGANDNLIPNRFLNAGRTADVAMKGQKKIAGSKLVIVPKAGHFLQFEKPEEVNKEIIGFLGK